MNKIHIDKIIVGDRARNDFGDLGDLAESLLVYGFIHPIALDKSGKIVAGGRRFAALSELWRDRKVHSERDDADASMLRFLRNGELELGVHFTSKVDAELAACDEMELEENVRRKNFTWKEEVVAINKIHKRNKKRARERGESWGVRETARILGVSHASIGYATKLYECLQDPAHPIHDCSSATDALHKLVQLKADEARKLAVSRNLVTTAKPRKGGVELSPEDLAAELNADMGEFMEFEVDNTVNIDPVPFTTEPSADAPVVSLSKFHHGEFLTLIENGTLPRGYFHHILTDPPYGIDVNNMIYGDERTIHERIASTHDAKGNQANFLRWLQGFWTVMADSGWALVWCDFEHFTTLSNLAREVGFEPQRWPFVWCKTHTCLNQAAQHNFTKNIEACLLLRKGNATLRKPQTSSYFMASNHAVRQQLVGHPFVKPFELWRHLADAVAVENERILDPFAGVGSSVLALIDKYDVWSCEIDEGIHTQQLTGLMAHYAKLFPGAKFTR